jgi:hypothetical protein
VRIKIKYIIKYYFIMNTTNIADLPQTENTIMPVQNNPIQDNPILKEIPQKEETVAPSQNNTITLDPITISQITDSLKQLNPGSTQLNSRDIPQNSLNITNDPHIQPNYVPKEQSSDYINNEHNELSQQDALHVYNNQSKQSDGIINVYNELQYPILLALLFYLFNLQAFQFMLFTYFKFLFSNDGNYNSNGAIAVSILFGTLFYVINKLNVIFNIF